MHQLAQTGLLRALKQRCAQGPSPLASHVRLAYTVPGVHLRSLLLSKRGVHILEDETHLDLCTECDTELRRNVVPPCAIANGLAIGPHRDTGPTFDVIHPVHGPCTMQWREVRTAEFSGAPPFRRGARGVKHSVANGCRHSVLHSKNGRIAGHVHWWQKPCASGQHSRHAQSTA